MAALSDVAPDYMTQTALPRLVAMATDKDLETRHGAMHATGEVVLALRNHWQQRKNSGEDVDILSRTQRKEA